MKFARYFYTKEHVENILRETEFSRRFTLYLNKYILVPSLWLLQIKVVTFPKYINLCLINPPMEVALKFLSENVFLCMKLRVCKLVRPFLRACLTNAN